MFILALKLARKKNNKYVIKAQNLCGEEGGGVDIIALMIIGIWISEILNINI